MEKKFVLEVCEKCNKPSSTFYLEKDWSEFDGLYYEDYEGRRKYINRWLCPDCTSYGK